MYIILILIVILSFILFYIKNKKKIAQQYIAYRKAELELQAQSLIKEKISQQEALNNTLHETENLILHKQQELNLVQQQLANLTKQLETYEEEQKETIDHYLEIIKEIKTNEIHSAIEREAKALRQQEEQAFNLKLQEYELARQKAEAEIDKISSELDAYRAKQDAINQEILRRRELEERKDFYRVCLSDDAIADISLLQATRQNLKKPEIIDKIIYDNYVAKPVLEMIKRVLQNTTCSGIYKITCQETKEIYIGKSTDIKNRWQQHCKTAFNCGTIASSILHRKMQLYGIENFTFELLETVPKDKLSEREKYYIDFYKTKEVGLNERNG